MKLLIATSNPGKVQEFKELLARYPFDVVTPSEAGLSLLVEEDGKTYRENAAKKASAYSIASGMVCIGDDSGLEVVVLDGAPGLYSARFSPKPGATDADRRLYLLEKLARYRKPWKAKFHATVAIGFPDGRVEFTVGDCLGEIIGEERGDNGFGYDPIFFIPELGKTMAELSTDEKNQLSHRARAVKLAIPILLSTLGKD